MAGPVSDATESVREAQPSPITIKPEEKFVNPPQNDYRPDTAASVLRGRGEDFQLVDKTKGTLDGPPPSADKINERPGEMLKDLQDMTTPLPADLRDKVIKGAADATAQFMKDKGGFDYKPTGDADKDWAAISKVLDGLPPNEQTNLLKSIFDATTKVLHQENEKYRHGPFGENTRANYLYDKQSRHEPLTEKERNDLYGFEEFPNNVYLGYLAGRQLNHDHLTPEQISDLDRARISRDDRRIPRERMQ